MAVEVGSSRARTVDGVTYIGGDSVMHALDTKSGEKKWEFTADGKRPVSTPVASRGTVYFRSDTALYAVEG
ncbi:PQQ-binding-like beta-propeller repeat protein [Streptomyces sp. NRRL F-5053]